MLTRSSVVVASVALAWGALGLATSAFAHEPHPGLEFSIGIDGVEGCNTRGGDATCEVPAGSNFALEVHLARLPDDIANYGGFDIYVGYTGVQPLEDIDMSVWPDCGFPASFYGDGFIGFGCAIGVPPAGPSTYAGLIAKNTFVCESSGNLTLRHGAGLFTDLIGPIDEGADGQSFSLIHAEGDQAEESIDVRCVEPAPTPTPTDVQPRPGLPETGSQSAKGPEWFSVLAILLAAGSGALFLSTLFSRRRP